MQIINLVKIWMGDFELAKAIEIIKALNEFRELDNI